MFDILYMCQCALFFPQIPWQDMSLVNSSNPSLHEHEAVPLIMLHCCSHAEHSIIPETHNMTMKYKDSNLTYQNHN